MIKLGGQSTKTHRAGSMIPLLRKQKMLSKAHNPSDKGLWAKKYADIIPF
jgi:hypothetical protein